MTDNCILCGRFVEAEAKPSNAFYGGQTTVYECSEHRRGHTLMGAARIAYRALLKARANYVEYGFPPADIRAVDDAIAVLKWHEVPEK